MTPFVIPARFRQARPRALRGQGAAGIQMLEQRTLPISDLDARLLHSGMTLILIPNP